MKENQSIDNEKEKIEPNIKVYKKRLVLKDKNFDEIYSKINFLKQKHKEHEQNEDNNKIFSYYNYDIDKIMKDEKLRQLFEIMDPNIQINSYTLKSKNNYDFKNKFQNFRINQNNLYNSKNNYENNNNFNKTVKLKSYRNKSSFNIHNNNNYNNYNYNNNFGGTLRNSNSTNFFKTTNQYIKPSFRYDYYNKQYYDENYNNYLYKSDNYDNNNYYRNDQLFEYKLSNPWQAKYEYKDYLNEINKLDEALNIVGNYKIPSKFQYRKKFYY